MVEGYIMYQRVQKICREKIRCIKVFLVNLGKFGQTIPCTPKKLPVPTPMLTSTWVSSHRRSTFQALLSAFALNLDSMPCQSGQHTWFAALDTQARYASVLRSKKRWESEGTCLRGSDTKRPESHRRRNHPDVSSSDRNFLSWLPRSHSWVDLNLRSLPLSLIKQTQVLLLQW